MNFLVWLIYLLGCLWPLSISNPTIVTFYSCKFPTFGTFVWRMIMLYTMLTRMKIKTLILHVANSMTMLAFRNLILNQSMWRWIFFKESNTLEPDFLGIIWNVIGHFHFVSKTCFVLVVDDLFPRSDDGLGKCKRNLFMKSFIFNWIFFWSGITNLIMWWLLIGIILKFKKRIVLNKD